MTTMVEKVAIAIFCSRENDEQEMWDRSRGPWKDEYRSLARAAIEAMKEPSHEMMKAMFEAMFEEKFDGTSAPMIGAGFEAAIQASLKENGQ